MKTNLILTILVAITIIVLNFPGLTDRWITPLQTTASTIAILVLLIIYQASKAFKKNSDTSGDNISDTFSPANTNEIKALPPFQKEQPLDEFICTIMDAYLTITEEQEGPDESEKKRLLNELDIYRQSYLWCVQMQKKYGKQWADAFQGATLPLELEDYPRLRSLIAEIALQTMDFCRYRTNDINLQDRMMVNPRSVLMDCSVQEAGAQELKTNPYYTPKEVLALYELFGHDKVQLQQASIHGYIIINKKTDINNNTFYNENLQQ